MPAHGAWAEVIDLQLHGVQYDLPAMTKWLQPLVLLNHLVPGQSVQLKLPGGACVLDVDVHGTCLASRRTNGARDDARRKVRRFEDRPQDRPGVFADDRGVRTWDEFDAGDGRAPPIVMPEVRIQQAPEAVRCIGLDLARATISQEPRG